MHCLQYWARKQSYLLFFSTCGFKCFLANETVTRVCTRPDSCYILHLLRYLCYLPRFHNYRHFVLLLCARKHNYFLFFSICLWFQVPLASETFTRVLCQTWFCATYNISCVICLDVTTFVKLYLCFVQWAQYWARKHICLLFFSLVFGIKCPSAGETVTRVL